MALHPVFVSTQVRVRYSLPWDMAQTLPGGATYEAAQDSARAAFHTARSEIIAKHNRSGALAVSMRTDMDKRGSKVVRGIVRSDVEHAKWFFEGTANKGAGRIFPKGSTLYLQPGWNGFTPRRAKSVRGQKSKKYILEHGAVMGLARVAGTGVSTPRGVQVRF